MFTGLIEEIGTVRRIERGAKGARLTIAADTVLENTKIGDSIATNGVCLTVVALTDDSFSADVMRGEPAAFRARQSAERLAGQSGARHACRRPVRRSHRLRPHRRHRLDSLAARARTTPCGYTIETPARPAPVHRRKGLDRHRRRQPYRGGGGRTPTFRSPSFRTPAAQTILLGKKPGRAGQPRDVM